MTKIVASDGTFDSIPGRKISMRSDIKFNVALFVFVFWTLSQAIMPMQILSFGLVNEVEDLKSMVPAFGILICGLIYIDKLKINEIFLPFILFCLFAFLNASFHLIVTGDNIKYLSQSIMFFAWTFCMFILVPSVFDSLYKIKKLLGYSIFVLVFVVLFSSLWAYSHGFEIARIFGGSGLRYSFVYINPLYLGGICYTVLCGSLMLRELSEVNLEKNLLLLCIFLSMVVIVLANTRTYIVASLILLLIYFWHKGGFLKKISWIILVGFVLLSLRTFWGLCIEENYLDYLSGRSSGRLIVWLAQFKHTMLDGIEWKALLGNGIYTTGGQVIQVAEGRVTQTFTRFAIDNLYLEMLIMQGAIGLTLFVWGLVRLLAKGNMFSELKGMAEEGRLRSVLSIAYGSLWGIVVGAVFYSHFPSLGNTTNSVVFPASLAMIFTIRRHVYLKNKSMAK